MTSQRAYSRGIETSGAPSAKPAVAAPNGSAGDRAGSSEDIVGSARVEPIGKRLRRWIVRGSLAAFCVSIGIHVVLLIIAAIWTMGIARAGGSTGREAGEIDVAIMSEAELGAIEEAALEAGSPSVGDVSESSASVDALEADVPSVESAAGSAIGDIADSMSGAGGDIDGVGGFGESGAGGGAAKFFGVEATGTRFAYIVDVSGSMQGGKLSALKIELIESVDALLEHMQFFVTPFSSDAMLLGNKEKWSLASDNGKKWARGLITELPAYGGTMPLASFQRAFDLKPRPDAIYFMTDGLFPEDVVQLVANMNRRGKRVPIHCIAFDIQDRAVETMMKRIAQESGGEFTSVPLIRSSR